MQTDLQIIQGIVGKYRTGLKVEDLATIVYRQVKALKGHDAKVNILNGRYIEFNGKRYQFQKDNLHETWNVKPW